MTEEHDGEDGGGTEGEPAGVGTDVSGLHAAGECAEAAGGRRRAVPEPWTMPRRRGRRG